VPGRLAKLEGVLGGFRAYAQGPQTLLDIGPLSANRDGCYDLVLDLSRPPVLCREVPPQGYYAPGDDPAALRQALQALPGLRGDIHKPRYFRFDPALCAHLSHGVQGCTRCLEVCPAEAIRCGKEGVEVDPRLCQGCGTCTLVCPSGALRYDHPSPRLILRELRSAIGEATEAPTVRFHEPGGARSEPPGPVVSIQVHALASVGPEIWLAALAWGARRVVLEPSPTLPPSSLRALNSQLGFIRQLLGHLGLPVDALAPLEAETQDAGGPAQGLVPPLRPAEADITLPKRALLLQLMDTLAPPEGTPDPMALAPGAPFGGIQVDAEACTLCTACVSLCPAGALGAQEASLWFLESRCVQCGICERGCPEGALHRVPRLTFDRGDRARPCRLHQADMARCVDCGAPFLAAQLVQKGLARILSDPRLRDTDLSRLKMCPACRIKATMEDSVR